MARIEILKRGDKYRAQFRSDNGKIDSIAVVGDSQQDMNRKLLEWKAQVNRASIHTVPPKQKPEAKAPAEAPEGEGLGSQAHAEDDGAHAANAANDSQYTVDELMDMKKVDLQELARSSDISDDGTKAEIAQRIVDSQG